MAHKECRYCDGGFYPKNVGGDLVCSSCGAEWDPIIIEEEEEI